MRGEQDVQRMAGRQGALGGQAERLAHQVGLGQVDEHLVVVLLGDLTTVLAICQPQYRSLSDSAGRTNIGWVGVLAALDGHRQQPRPILAKGEQGDRRIGEARPGEQFVHRSRRRQLPSA